MRSGLIATAHQLATPFSPAYNAATGNALKNRGRGMASERIQRQVDRLLDEAAEAVGQGDWALVRDCSQKVLVVDPVNQEALTFMAIAERGWLAAWLEWFCLSLKCL